LRSHISIYGMVCKLCDTSEKIISSLPKLMEKANQNPEFAYTIDFIRNKLYWLDVDV
jgi:hypothetical protein